MKISPSWLRDFVDLPVDYRRLADELTLAGVAVEGISGEADGTVFEMEITTNRPDAMNHYGVAREASALYDLPLKAIELKLPAAKGKSDVTIDILEPELCPRFTAREIHGVSIRPSAAAIASRLELLEQRPISNAVDATNYVLWESGKPTHVFDLDLLEGRRLVIRKAQAGETLKTLDGVERKLTPEDLVVADAVKPVALAGVMGGFDTMITEKTKNILIESAWFDPAAVRKTAKRHGLHTDASHRFERGADYGATPLACSLVAQRIIESGAGEIDGGIIDAVAREIDQAPVVLRVSQVHRILGSKLETHEIVAILKRLGFELVPEPAAQPEFSVRIPTWRLDVEREIDLLEEIARLHGYNNFPNTLPAFSGAVVENPRAAKEAKLRSSLLSLGYNEAVSLSFISHEDAETFSSSPVIELANPLSEEASLMRSSLLPGMLNMLAHNLNRGTEYVRLFEIGDVYEASGENTVEHKRICLAATAAALHHDIPQGGVLDKSKVLSELDVFRSFKGAIETLLSAFGYKSLRFDTQTSDYYHPGRSARALMDGEVVSQLGQLHSEIASGRKLRQEVYVAEVFADRLYQRALREIRYGPLPKFPGVERDFSFLFSDDVTFARISDTVQYLRLAELRSLDAVEIFRGGGVVAGQYSILLRAKFQSLERTLREQEVAEWSSQVVSALKELGGTQRA